MSLILILCWLGFIQNPIERNLTNHSAHDRYASYSPDGNKILFESDRSGSWDIYIMSPDGSRVVQLTSDSTNERRPCWHPDGKQVLFESDRTGKFQLYKLKINDLKIELLNLSETAGTPIFARYAPNGALAFSLKYEGDSSKIIVLDTKGQLEYQFLDDGFRSFYPSWSSDSQRLLLFSRHETDNKDDEIYQIDLIDKKAKRLTNWPTHNFCPAWSPNDSLIAFAQSMENSRPEIYIMNADGSGSKRLTYNEDGDTLPQWSPDGSKLLLTAYREGNFEIIEVTIP